MQCPFCGFRESKVVDSRHTDPNTIRRRRECEECKKRFTTYEKIETTPIMVIKKDDTREVFDRDKVKRGIMTVSYTHLTLPTIHYKCRSRWSPYH